MSLPVVLVVEVEVEALALPQAQLGAVAQEYPVSTLKDP